MKASSFLPTTLLVLSHHRPACWAFPSTFRRSSSSSSSRRSMTPRLASTTMQQQGQDGPNSTNKNNKRVAVIGAGAAGLVASRLLREAGFACKVFEKSDSVGGVWKYRPEDVMYESLVTNLPKEIMAFLDFPFDPSLPSFLTHAQVQNYLEGYTHHHRLQELISFNTEVKAVRPLVAVKERGEDGKEQQLQPLPPGDYTVWNGHDDNEEEDEEPKWQVITTTGGSTSSTSTTTSTTSSSPSPRPSPPPTQEEIFDAVIICNGHFDIPYTPPLPGLTTNYKGLILHSRHYDHPQTLFQDKKVLCIGYKSSGTDIAREVSKYAKEVHVVDRRLTPTERHTHIPPAFTDDGEEMKQNNKKEELLLQQGNIYRRPGLKEFIAGGDGKTASFIDGTLCEDIDVVLLCTGYCYSMPFLTGGDPLQQTHTHTHTKEALLLQLEDRAVHPLYQHLFHAYFPSLTFMGLLHSVVPFPLFDLQARWIVTHLQNTHTHTHTLPPRAERFHWLEEERKTHTHTGKQSRDWHYAGPGQWAYKRMVARVCGCLDEDLEEKLRVREEIYDDVSKRRPAFPGGSDCYRRCEYRYVEGGEKGKGKGKGGWTVDVKKFDKGVNREEVAPFL